MDSQNEKKINNNKKANKSNEPNKPKDHLFITKIWYSMTKFEYYPEMAAHGVPRALIYLAKLMAIFSIIFTAIVFIYVNRTINVEEQKEEVTFVQKWEQTLGIQLDEATEINQAVSKYDTKTISIIFAIASIISVFISYFIITLIDVLTLSFFGMITCYFAKIKIKYRAVFNMSIYAITISVILRLIYEALLLLTDFKIKYFNIMYTAISYICLAAAIFMIRADLIKQQIELMKIIEEKKQKSIEDEQRENKEEEKGKEEENKEDNENKKRDDNQDGEDELGRGDEQGSNA